MRSLVLILVLAVSMATAVRFEVQLFSNQGAKKMLNNPKFRSMMDDVLSSMERQMEADIRRMERQTARQWSEDDMEEDMEEDQPHYSRRDSLPTAHMGTHSQSHPAGGRPHHYGTHGGRPHHYGHHPVHHHRPNHNVGHHPAHAGHHGPTHGSPSQHHGGERPASSSSSAGGHHPAHAGHHASCRPRPCPAIALNCATGFERKTPLDEAGCPMCPQCVAVAPATEEETTTSVSTHRPAHCPHVLHCHVRCSKGYELRRRKNSRGCNICPVCVPTVSLTTKKTYLTSGTTYRHPTSAPGSTYRPHHQLYMGIVPKFVRRYKRGYLYEIKANVPKRPSSDKYQLTIDVKLSKPGWGVEVATFAHPNRHYRIESEGSARDEVTLHLSKSNLPHVALQMYSPVPLKWTTLALYDPAGLTGYAAGRPSTEHPTADDGFQYGVGEGSPFAFFGLTLGIFAMVLFMLLIIKCCVRCSQKRRERENRRNSGGATYQSLPKSEFSTPPPAPLRVYPQTHIAVPQYNPASVEGGALYPHIYAQKE